ncbi:MAG: Rossmann-like and DUF2520 domain-containing protein [Actinomycetota bacterium]
MTFDAPPAPYRVVLVGAGAVGTAAAYLLRSRGHEIVGVASRSAESARRGAAALGSQRVELHDPIVGRAGLVLVGAPDHAVAGIAEALGPRLEPGAGVVHFAGSLGVAPLAAVVASGAAALALHPVQACPDAATAIRRLPGSAWGVTASPGADRWARDLVTDGFSGTPVEVAEPDRPLWHAAAVMASNGLAALLGAGESLLDGVGVGAPGDVLGPLLAGTLANALEGGGGARTITGPAVRGDAVTVARHLAALEGRPYDRRAYVLATLLVVAAARRAGRIDESTYARIVGLVGSP